MRPRSTIFSTSFLNLILLISCTHLALGVQHFTARPADTTRIEGQGAILKCAVEDLGGQRQWVKDGFGLGVNPTLPGNPRYEVKGNLAAGEYNLVIRNVALADDAEFECQVGPSPGHPAISAKAHLHIQVPPKVPEIIDHLNGTMVEVLYQQMSVNLTCVSRGGKPAATITWYKNNNEITDNQQYWVEATGDKLMTAMSMLTVYPERYDNAALFACHATNAAADKLTLQTIVELSVMHPPGKPEIKGYETGRVVQTGDTLHLKCIARGGNPPAQVHWHKNGAVLDLSYKTGDGQSENDLYMTVQPNDNNAVYRCEASNRVNTEPMVSEVKLIVQFGPEKMTITGSQHAKVGETITLTCTSDISNPPAEITWSGQGKEIQYDTHDVVASPKGGFVTTSNITVELTNKQDTIYYTCNGICNGFNKVHTSSASIELSVMYPPDTPIISGYTDGKEVEAKKVLSLTCQAQGGNPLATISWWKGNKAIESVVHTYQKIVESRIDVTLLREDNQAEYYCNATNPATEMPLSAKVTLTVNYPPTKLNITTYPAVPRAGRPLTVVCSSDASNPESQLTWWKDGRRVRDMKIRTDTTKAEYGGVSSRSELDVTLTEADDAQIYECRATNRVLEKAVNDAIKLDVSYQPVFAASAEVIHHIIEYESSLLNLTATGNPSSITYVWYKGNERLMPHKARRKRRDVSIPYFIINGPLLNVTNVTRQDADVYTVEATNSEGATNFSMKLDVQYPAEILKVTESVNVDHNSAAILECHFGGNPLPTKITWARAGYNMSRSIEETSERLSKLVVSNVTKEDSGTFVCTVSNGVKDAASTDLKLVVKYAPEINRAPHFSKAAARNMETGHLLCKAEGAPSVTFKWFRKNAELDVTGIRYNEATKKDTIVSYTSTLTIVNVTLEDYGTYQCKATNQLGTDQHSVHLADTSEPEAPYDLQSGDVTHNSVTLSWTPGFNGGAPQQFRIRYRRKGMEGFKTEEVTPRNATVYVITGLSRGTEYRFSVQGENVFGASSFGEYVSARTAVSPVMQDDNIPLIIILTVSIFGMLLLALNILLILFFYRRRRKKLEKDASEGASNANTVEMFSAPTITEDSKSYSTYDRSLEDFPDDYRVYDPEDELKQFLPPPTYTSFYRPPSSNLYGPPPHVGSAPHLGPVPFGPSPAFDNQRPSGPHPWDNRKYDMYGSMPRVPPTNPPDDREEYANQLRALQQGVTTTLPRDPTHRSRQPYDSHGPASLPPPSRAPPPLPPTRSSSHQVDGLPHSMPPLPSRNYDREEMPPGGPANPHYAPPPATTHRVSPRPPSVDVPHPPTPEMRGQLV